MTFQPYVYGGGHPAARRAAEAVDTTKSPIQLATLRAEAMYTTWLERDKFLMIFRQILIAELRGRDTWHLYRASLEAGDSVAVSAYIEGAASARTYGKDAL